MAEPITNRQASQDPRFLAACKRFGVAPTVRQASKLRNKRGALYAAARRARQSIPQE